MPGPIEDLRRGAEGVEKQAAMLKDSLAQGDLESIFVKIKVIEECLSHLKRDAKSYFGIHES